MNGRSSAQVCLILNESGQSLTVGLSRNARLMWRLAVPSVCKTPRLWTLSPIRPTELFSPPDWLPLYFCKTKARLSISLIKRRFIRNKWNSKNIAQSIGIRWTWDVSFTLRQLYIRESAPVSHSILGWVDSRSGLETVENLASQVTHPTAQPL